MFAALIAPVQTLADRFEAFQEFVVRWRLEEKCGGSGIEGLGTNRGIVLAGQDDDLGGRGNGTKLRLKFEAAHYRHPNVEDDQRGVTRLRIPEKDNGVGERFGLPTRGRKEPSGRLEDRRIIVNQANGDIMMGRPSQLNPLFPGAAWVLAIRLRQ
jgi:hypothetical protein